MSKTPPYVYKLLRGHEFKRRTDNPEKVDIYLPVFCEDCFIPVAINEVTFVEKDDKVLLENGLFSTDMEKPQSGFIPYAGGVARCKSCLEKWKVLAEWNRTAHEERVKQNG